ncbi:MAG TPA: phosphopantetheine-binding protein [Bacteroidia bacterium]|nr:phosphopantetheine-binding protein [Bacteroidia bacterium]
MDDIKTFIGKLEAELEGLTPGSLTPETNYRQMPEWSSMHALILIALAETEYNISVTGDDLRSCETINDLYALLKSRTS